jgi:hypothetical protein
MQVFYPGPITAAIVGAFVPITKPKAPENVEQTPAFSHVAIRSNVSGHGLLLTGTGGSG